MLSWASRRALTYECGHGRHWSDAHDAAYCPCEE